MVQHAFRIDEVESLREVAQAQNIAVAKLDVAHAQFVGHASRVSEAGQTQVHRQHAGAHDVGGEPDRILPGAATGDQYARRGGNFAG